MSNSVWNDLLTLVDSQHSISEKREFVVGGYTSISDDSRLSITYYPLVGKYDVVRHKKAQRISGWEECLTLSHDDYFEEVIEECSPSDTGLSEEEKQSRNIARSLRRVRATCRELLLSNPWEYWVTFTISDKKCDRYDFKSILKLFLGVVKRRNERKNSAPLKYLLFPEQHKDGAFHFHGFLMGVDPDELVVNEHGYLDIPLFSEAMGFVNVCPVRPLPQKERYALLIYTMKYAQKNVGSGNKDLRRGYYRSDGLERGIKITLPPCALREQLCEIHETVASYENDYIQKRTYEEEDFSEILGLLNYDKILGLQNQDC